MEVGIVGDEHFTLRSACIFCKAARAATLTASWENFENERETKDDDIEDEGEECSGAALSGAEIGGAWGTWFEWNLMSDATSSGVSETVAGADDDGGIDECEEAGEDGIGSDDSDSSASSTAAQVLLKMATTMTMTSTKSSGRDA
jgi:hypothetical protein